jgi:dCTP deaminase
MIFSDRDIRQQIKLGRLRILPEVEDHQIQPASVDLRLGESFKRFKPTRRILDVKDQPSISDANYAQTIPLGAPVQIEPGEFLLAVTHERVELPDDIVGRVEGRSSVGRLGLAVHVTAGYIDPGFKGQITLEFANLNRYAIRLYVGMRIAQIVFERTTTPALRPYGSKGLGSKYQNQQIKESKIAQDVLRTESA